MSLYPFETPLANTSAFTVVDPVLFKLVTGEDVISTFTSPEFATNMELTHVQIDTPMYIMFEYIPELDAPVFALKAMNFFGTSNQLSIARQHILYTSFPRKAVADFYLEVRDRWHSTLSRSIDSSIAATHSSWSKAINNTVSPSDASLHNWMKGVDKKGSGPSTGF